MKNNKTIKFKGAHFNRSFNFSFVYFSQSGATAAIPATGACINIQTHTQCSNPKLNENGITANLVETVKNEF